MKMSFLDQIGKLLKIEKDEGRLVALLFLYSFLVGMTRVFTFMPTQAIFLDRYSSSTLPWVYILAAVSTVAVGAIYLKLGNYCLLYTSPSPRDGLLSRMPSSA